jgi:hypothetical protein
MSDFVAVQLKNTTLKTPDEDSTRSMRGLEKLPLHYNVLVHRNLIRRLVDMHFKLPEIVRTEVGVLDQDVPSPTGISV